MPKPEITRNTQIHVFACFLVRALPEVRDQIWKQFFDKVLYNYSSKFYLWSVSPQKMALKKMDFPLYFQKVIWPGRVHFLMKFFSEKSKHPKICLSFGGSMPETVPANPPLYGYVSRGQEAVTPGILLWWWCICHSVLWAWAMIRVHFQPSIHVI